MEYSVIISNNSKLIGLKVDIASLDGSKLDNEDIKKALSEFEYMSYALIHPL